MHGCTRGVFTANDPRNIIKGRAFLEGMHITHLLSCQNKLRWIMRNDSVVAILVKPCIAYNIEK